MEKKIYSYPQIEVVTLVVNTGLMQNTSIQLPPDMAPERKDPKF